MISLHNHDPEEAPYYRLRTHEHSQSHSASHSTATTAASVVYLLYLCCQDMQLPLGKGWNKPAQGVNWAHQQAVDVGKKAPQSTTRAQGLLADQTNLRLLLLRAPIITGADVLAQLHNIFFFYFWDVYLECVTKSGHRERQQI